MDTEETALVGVEFNEVLRQHGQGFAITQFSDPPAADARGPAEKHTFGPRYDHDELQFDFCGGFGLEATS